MLAWLLAGAVLTAPVPALARDADRGQPTQRIWDAYPLTSAKDRSSGSPAAPPRGSASPSTNIATAPADDFARLAVASVLALIAGALTTWLVSMRWPRARVVSVGAAMTPPDPEPLRSTAPELWLSSAEVAQPAPSTPPEPPPVAGPSPPAGPPRLPAPPDPGRTWAAEIGWHLTDRSARFRVTARPVDGGEPISLGESSLLEWPPAGARSVQELTDAVKLLESTLVAAGWTPLPRGSAWYAKRFTWRPGARPRPTPATAGRTRHRKLYEAEYARQIDRTQRMRRTVSARLIAQTSGAQPTGTAPQ